MQRADLLIVGAGPAGLSVAAAARERGWRAVLLERADTVGGLWVQVSPELRCLSSRRLDRLPDGSVPEAARDRATADQVRAAWQGFARRARFELYTGCEVTALAREPGGYSLSAGGERWSAPRVVLATGEHGRPWIPALPGQFGGPVQHSAHADADEIEPGERVALVGSGNSAAELLPRLLARGARVTLCAKTPPRRPRPQGRVTTRLGWWLSATPTRLLPPALRCAGTVPVFDPDLHLAVGAGQVQLAGEVTGLSATGLLTEQAEVVVDRVLFATGFRRELSWVEGLRLDAGGLPRHRGGLSEELPGVAFMGLPCMRSRRSGFLRGLVADGRAVVAGLARSR